LTVCCDLRILERSLSWPPANEADELRQQLVESSRKLPRVSLLVSARLIESCVELNDSDPRERFVSVCLSVLGFMGPVPCRFIGTTFGGGLAPGSIEPAQASVWYGASDEDEPALADEHESRVGAGPSMAENETETLLPPALGGELEREVSPPTAACCEKKLMLLPLDADGCCCAECGCACEKKLMLLPAAAGSSSAVVVSHAEKKLMLLLPAICVEELGPRSDPCWTKESSSVLPEVGRLRQWPKA